MPALHRRRLRRLLLLARARDQRGPDVPLRWRRVATQLAPPAGGLPRPLEHRDRVRHACPPTLWAASGTEGPTWGPSRRLDIELELGFVAGGPPNQLGEAIPIERAAERIFGFVLVNDWSARDVQAWESRPLGPFLAKSFATSISPWVVPRAALDPYRVAPPRQEPEPFRYLRLDEPWALDLELEAALQPAGGAAHTTAATNARELYWTAPQQLAHAASGGAIVRPGDLFAAGTISGAGPGRQGCLLELTWNGERPLHFDASTRTFLEDGDVVRMTARTGARDGRPRIGFGELRGEVLPAAEGA